MFSPKFTKVLGITETNKQKKRQETLMTATDDLNRSFEYLTDN